MTRECFVCHRERPASLVRPITRQHSSLVFICINGDDCIKARQGTTDRTMRRVGAPTLPGLFGEAS